jgi:nucleoside triphosphate pyrophosphatase
MHILLLGSQSFSRQRLLHEAKIPFQVIEQNADESVCDWGLSFDVVLKSIALEKMKHVLLPDGKEGDECFVLTADSMCKDADGIIHGKPIDKADAINKLKAWRKGGYAATAFCLEKKRLVNGIWHITDQVIEVVSATFEFDMPDTWIEKSLKEIPQYLSLAGAFTVTGYGAQFLKSVNGSYTTIIGLPMFEIREALQELDFFK